MPRAFKLGTSLAQTGVWGYSQGTDLVTLPIAVVLLLLGVSLLLLAILLHLGLLFVPSELLLLGHGVVSKRCLLSWLQRRSKSHLGGSKRLLVLRLLHRLHLLLIVPLVLNL